ncbi:MAG: hypothetical protein R2878_12820 [Thermoleophilia bacterium]
MKVRSAWARGAVATVALGGFVLASAGCVSLDGVFAEQPDRIGDLTIHGTVCLSGSPGCSGQDNIDLDVPAFSGQGQLLVGYRVPPGITAPASLSSDSPTTTLAANAGYAAELERLSPAGPGRVWVGYVTNTLVVNGAVDPNIAVTARFGLPQGADGSPFAGPVGYRAVAGFRLVDATHPADRPVNCGANITDVMPDSTVCIDAPLATTVAGDDAVFGTRDLGIITGAKASGLAGTTVMVPFTTKYAGTSTASVNFALSASTTLPGAGVTVTPGSLLPATDSTNPVQVAVAVPANATPGDYPVTLTATLGAQTRTRGGVLTVTAPPVVTTAARISGLVPKRLAFRVARRRGVKVVVRSNLKGLAIVRLYQGRKAPRVSRRVRLRVGRTGVLLRNSRLVAGRYRVTVTMLTPRKTVTIRGVLRKR